MNRQTLAHFAAALITVLLATRALSVLADTPAISTDSTLVSGDIIVSDEGPFCSVRGLWYVHNGQPHVLGWGAPMELPRGLAQSPDGTLVVADAQAGLARYSPATGAFDVIKANPPANPRSVAWAPYGHLVIADWTAIPNAPGAIYDLAPDGTLKAIARGGPIVNPHSVTVAPDGSIVVADVHSGILRIANDGAVTVLHPIGADLLGPSAVTAGSDGTIYAADILGAAVIKIAPTGQLTVLYRGDPLQHGVAFPVGVVGGPRGIALDDLGHPVVLDEKAKALFSLPGDGTIANFADLSSLCSPADLLIYRGPTMSIPLVGTPAPQTPVDTSLLRSGAPDASPIDFSTAQTKPAAAPALATLSEPARRILPYALFIFTTFPVHLSVPRLW